MTWMGWFMAFCAALQVYAALRAHRPPQHDPYSPRMIVFRAVLSMAFAFGFALVAREVA